MSERRDRAAGDVILHPVAAVAVLVLLVNDHVIKDRWPGFVTGKLSDLAGLLFFPVLVVAVLDLCRNRVGVGPTPRAVVGTCVVLTGVVFAAAELVPQIDAILEVVWAWLRWPLAMLGRDVPTPVVMTADPTDLLALPALWVAWVLVRTRPQGEPIRP